MGREGEVKVKSLQNGSIRVLYTKAAAWSDGN